MTSVYLLSALVALTVGCDTANDRSTGDPKDSAAPAAAVPPAAPVKSGPDLHGFTFPIAGACLPTSDRLVPNAERKYRKGTHEGIDFYDGQSCARIRRGTEVLAAKAGRVIRADWSYVDLTEATVAVYLKDPTSDASVDQFRGRQVWVDHGAGVVTRYCHLSGIAPGIASDTMVPAGQLIAFVGESGTPSSLKKPGSQYHLHFEVRVGDSYLGKGLDYEALLSRYRELFGVADK